MERRGGVACDEVGHGFDVYRVACRADQLMIPSQIELGSPPAKGTVTHNLTLPVTIDAEVFHWRSSDREADKVHGLSAREL